MENCRRRAGEGKACCGAVTPAPGAAHLGESGTTPSPPLTSPEGGGASKAEEGAVGAQGRPDKTFAGEEGSRLFSSTFGPQEELLQARDVSAARWTARVPTGPRDQQAGDRVHTVRGSCSLDPRQPGVHRGASPRNTLPAWAPPAPFPLQMRTLPGAEVPFSPTEPGTNGVYVGIPTAPAELSSRGQRPLCPEASPGVLGSRPKGASQGSAAGWSSRMRPWESKAPPHQGASELFAWRKCRQSSPQLRPRKTLPLGDEWGSHSTCSPGSTNCFQTQEGAAKDSGSLCATLDN